MKIIDLLNKIASGEVPNSFKYEDLIFKRHDDCGFAHYKDNDGDTFLDSMYNDLSNLNDEVEIIEEDKKIEKLNLYYHVDNDVLDKVGEKTNNILCDMCGHFRKHEDKINEIIDYINKEK